MDTTGPEVIEHAKLGGLYLDPWQMLCIELAHGIDKSGMLAASEVCLIVPRQNGKGSILEAVELSWLFLSKEELILHSAHEFKTSADAYKRLKARIKSNPEWEDQVRLMSDSHGNERIELHDGRELKFIARTANSGRGFPAKKIMLDEAFNMKEADLAAMMPTLGAAPDAQVWYTSTPVNQEQHKFGLPLSRIRRRGIANGEDLCFIEYSAPEDTEDFYAKAPLYQANPGLGLRVTERSLMRDARVLSRKSYGVEHLGIGDWPEEEEANRVISMEVWDALVDSASRIIGPRVFAIACAPQGKRTTIAVAGQRADKLYHLEIVKTDKGSGWAVEAVAALQRMWSPLGTVIDMRSPAAGLRTDLEAAKVKLIDMKAGDLGVAFSGIVSKVMATQQVRHLGQVTLREAVAGGRPRNLGTTGAETWDLMNADVDATALVAVTNALHGFVTAPKLDVVGSIW